MWEHWARGPELKIGNSRDVSPFFLLRFIFLSSSCYHVSVFSPLSFPNGLSVKYVCCLVKHEISREGGARERGRADGPGRHRIGTVGQADEFKSDRVQGNPRVGGGGPRNSGSAEITYISAHHKCGRAHNIRPISSRHCLGGARFAYFHTHITYLRIETGMCPVSSRPAVVRWGH